jgi:hypothetical protein
LKDPNIFGGNRKQDSQSAKSSKKLRINQHKQTKMSIFFCTTPIFFTKNAKTLIIHNEEKINLRLIGNIKKMGKPDRSMEWNRQSGKSIIFSAIIPFNYSI